MMTVKIYCFQRRKFIWKKRKILISDFRKKIISSVQFCNYTQKKDISKILRTFDLQPYKD